HVALIAGDVSGDDVLVRVHSECLAGDVLGSQTCDCRAELEVSMRAIGEEGRGAVVYLRRHANDAPVGCGAGTGSPDDAAQILRDRKSTRLNSSHVKISYAVFCLKK